MNMKKFLKYAMSAAMLLTLATACDSYKDTDTPELSEADKNLASTWKLQQVTRNNIDITSKMDFSQFRLVLENNGNYHLENRLPFPVTKDGKWSVDDVKHPFQLELLEEGEERPVTVNIQYPFTDGERRLSITLSPGCESNTYVYNLVKAND